MRILKAQVVTNKDKVKIGQFLALCPDIGNDYVTITMTSPFYTRNGGGMLGIPDSGSEILILEGDKDNEYFYLSTILKEPEPSELEKQLKFEVIEDRNVYTERDKPQKITYEDQFGAGVAISNRYFPGYIDSKTEVTSRQGKKLLLSDSPNASYIFLRTENGDGLMITEDKTPFHSAQSIELKSVGPQRIVSFDGSQDIITVEGTEINIINHSTGVNGAPGRETQTGNINLESKQRDVNIQAGGRVFIITPLSRIQISDDGSIEIESIQPIKITSNLAITLKSDISVDIEAPILNLNTQVLNTGQGATTLTNVAGPVTMAGPLVPLNIDTPPERNAYGK